MSEENVKDYSVFNSINQVEGFDPNAFAVDYTDFNSGETRKRLPVLIQIGWFRLKYPAGRIACTVTPAKDCFMAHAKIYANHMDPLDCFLAEGSAARGVIQDKPSVSPREWAQTAAIGVALRNAGFGLQFGIAGEAVEPEATYELTAPTSTTTPAPEMSSADTPSELTPAPQPQPQQPTPPPAPPVDPLQAALQMPCGIGRYQGKTIGDLAKTDPNALYWIMTKSKLSDEIKAAAQLVVAHYAKQAV